jgi:hypothetical protein
LVAGCGDAPVPARGSRLDVALREFHLTPSSSSARPGRLTIDARNAGTLPHQLAVGRGRNALARTPIISPGRRAALDVRLPPGTYRLFCTLSNHDTLGLYGSLVVR